MEKKMMVVSAHAADWCTRAGGTIRGMIEEGWDVQVHVLTYGEHGESGAYWKNNPGSTFEACKACRKEEASRAAKMLGVSRIVFYDYGDYPLELHEKQIRGLTKEILDYRPSVILTHWICDRVNLDHETTGKAVINAVNAAGMLGAFPGVDSHMIPDIFFFETTVPQPEFNEFKIDTFINIDSVFEKKMEAVRCFEAQPQLIGYYTRTAETRGIQASDWARKRGKVTYAEGFVKYVPYVGEHLPLMEY